MLMGFLMFFLIFFNILPSHVSISKDCHIPCQDKIAHKTFVINPKLSCAANTFMYLAPSVVEKAEAQIGVEGKKQSPQTVGRLGYELLGDAFAKNKPNVPVSNFKIKGKDNIHEIPLRLYKGKNKDKTILFIHGGGWSQGNLKTHDALCRKLCEATGASILAVDYRLAPENPYPAGLEDTEAAYNWLVEHYQNAKVLVSGDSGGGNIATCLIIKLIQEKRRIPDGAILIYPALDLRIPEETMDPYANGYFLTRDRINAYIHNYLGDDYEKANDPLVSPVMASDKDLKKFPHVMIISAECDPLAAEGSQFAHRLKSLGVPVAHKVIPKTIHIFAQYFDLFPEAGQAIDFIAAKAFKN